MTELRFSDSIFVARPPEAVYAMVADVTRMGEWSPVCRACWWDDGAGPEAGAWFTGRNDDGERTWETRSQVSVADPGREFTFLVSGSYVRWSYTFEPAAGGTTLGESWEFLPDGLAFFAERFGDEADAQVAAREQAARRGIPQTLAAIKRAAES